MARIFTEGFEMGDKHSFPNVVSSTSVLTPSSGARSGTYFMRVQVNGTLAHSKTFPSRDELYIRVAMNMVDGIGGNAHRIAWRGTGGEEIGYIYMNGNTLQVYRGDGVLLGQSATLLFSSIWYLIEVHVKLSDTNGITTVRLDGGTVIDYAGNTKPGASTQMNFISLGSMGAGGDSATGYDDIAINDTLGEEDSGWCQDGHIILLKPNGDSTPLQMTPSTGTTHYTLVDEVPANTTDYVSGSVAGLIDVFDVESFTPVNQDITRVWVEARALDSLAEGGYISLGLQPSGSGILWSGSMIQLVSLTQSKAQEYTLNPVTGLPWTQNDLNALKVAVRSDSTEGGG